MISPAARYESAAKNALSAALWSSADADLMFKVIRPVDFHPTDDTIAAAILDLRQKNVAWDSPILVTESLRDYRQLWKDRVDARRFGWLHFPVPIEDTLDPDRAPLRFARNPLVSGRIYDIQTHIADVDVETSAREIAAIRRSEVTQATMQTVHRIVTSPPQDSTRAERQEAITRVMHQYRRDMFATHLFPPRTGSPTNRSRVGLGR